MATPERSVEIFAVQYAESDYYADQLYAVDARTDPEFGKGTEFVPFNWLFYVIRVTTAGKVRTILLDTGFTSVEPLKGWGMDALNGKPFVVRDQGELLASVGIRKEDVTDVVLTHHDFDHVGGQHLYPQAHVHVNRVALDTLLASDQAKTDTPEVVADLAARRGGDTVTEFDGEYDLEGIRMTMIGGHTPGSCVAEMVVGDTTYAFVADECYVLANAEEGKPIGYRIGDKAANVSFVRKMMARLRSYDSEGTQKGKLVKMAPDGDKIAVLPFHDPAVMTQFPPADDAGRIARIR